MGIIEHDLPHSFVEYEGYRALLEYLNTDIKHISRSTAILDV